jgi:hypothetical protein
MDNGAPWIPAVLLPADKMCELHALEWSLQSEDEHVARIQLVGSKFQVQIMGACRHVETKELLPNGDCKPLRIKWPDGHTSGCFSCEVSID